MLKMYETKTFSQVFEDFEEFETTIQEFGGSYANNIINSTSRLALYNMLYARYGNNPIINLSEEVFKAKLVANIYKKGPTWERRAKLQKDIRELTDDQLRAGARRIYNQALHPEDAPGTDTEELLTYINSQNVDKQQRSILDAYQYLMDLLKSDVNEEFISSFANLFSKFVDPDIQHIYVSDDEEEEEE